MRSKTLVRLVEPPAFEQGALSTSTACFVLDRFREINRRRKIHRSEGGLLQRFFGKNFSRSWGGCASSPFRLVALGHGLSLFSQVFSHSTCLLREDLSSLTNLAVSLSLYEYLLLPPTQPANSNLRVLLDFCASFEISVQVQRKTSVRASYFQFSAVVWTKPHICVCLSSIQLSDRRRDNIYTPCRARGSD